MSVFSDFRREPIVSVLTSHLNSVRQLNDSHLKLGIEIPAKRLMQVLRRPVERQSRSDILLRIESTP